MYIERFNNIIIDKQMNFSSKFNIKMRNNKLIVEKRESELMNMYGNNIKNITMILGKNGTGKTSVLDILGMKRDDRIKCSIRGSRDEILDSYLIIYHIKDNYYVLEVIDDKILSKITNVHNDKERNFFYKVPMAVILKEIDGEFYIENNLFDDNQNMEKIQINYINDKSKRIDYRRYRYSGDDGYLYKRIYKTDSSRELQYLYLYKLNNTKGLEFNKSIARLSIKCNIDYDKHTLEDTDEIKSKIEYLEDHLYIHTYHSIKTKVEESFNLINNEQQYSNKEKYIMDVLSKYIIDELVNGIYRTINDNRMNINENILDEDYRKLYNILENIKSSTYISSIDLLGKVQSIDVEFERLKKVIEYYKKQGLEKYLEYIYISRYLYSRIDTINTLGETKYQDAIEEFIANIKLLDDKYFKGGEVQIYCELKKDKNVINLLKSYDKYYNNQNEDGYINDLSSRFEIKVTNLSEGEEQFLMLNTKIFDILKNKNKDQTTILLLDEPDKALHPEWSRRFISNTVNEINNNYDTNIQLIITTHSPFMVSDINSRNVYCFENEESENSKRINIKSMEDRSKNIHNTFGANIYEILSDSFILNRTLGEFAYDKILDTINILQNETNEYNNTFIEEFIDIVGEKVIRDKLRHIHNKKKLNRIQNRKNQLIMLLENNDLDDEKLEKINKILEV